MADTYWPPGDPIESDNEDNNDTILKKPPPEEDVHDPMFYAMELGRALVDCGYGIHSWQQTPPNPDDSRLMASASIEVLDQEYKTFEIALDQNGYYVIHRPEKQGGASFLRRLSRRSASPFLGKLTLTKSDKGSSSGDSQQSDEQQQQQPQQPQQQSSNSSPSSRRPSRKQSAHEADPSHQLPPINYFETLEDLLCDISPAFNKTRAEILEQKLFGVAVRQQQIST